MKEIRAEFQIDDKDYILFIERKFWNYRVYLFQELKGRMVESIPVKRISASTIADVLEYWRIFLALHLRQKMKKEGRKSRCSNSRNGSGGNIS